MVEYKIAQSVHLESLKELYSSSFSVSKSMTEHFFCNKFNQTNCAVCLVDGEVAAALHMFDTYIFKDLKMYPVYYIYAVATFKKFRGKGYMKSLINYSNSLALKKGQLYSLLLPASESLYKFYEGLGYKKFFKVESLEFTYEELREIVDSKKFFVDNNLLNIEKSRSNNFCGDGDIFWNKEHIDYVISENRNCGGTTFYTESGYAICQASDECVDIIEFVSNNNYEDLLLKIISCFKRKKYKFRLKANLNYFEKTGVIRDFGMLKSLKEDTLKLFNLKCNPYLGLTLD